MLLCFWSVLLLWYCFVPAQVRAQYLNHSTIIGRNALSARPLHLTCTQHHQNAVLHTRSFKNVMETFALKALLLFEPRHYHQEQRLVQTTAGQITVYSWRAWEFPLERSIRRVTFPISDRNLMSPSYIALSSIKGYERTIHEKLITKSIDPKPVEELWKSIQESPNQRRPFSVSQRGIIKIGLTRTN